MIEWLDQFWQSLHPAIQVIIGGLVVAALLGIITLVMRIIHRSVVPPTEKKKATEEKLRVHFEDLRGEAFAGIISIISALTDWYGKVDIADNSAYPKGTELSEPSSSFAAHFPEETKDCRRYKQKIREHNKIYDRFLVKISNSIESQGIPVVNINSQVTPCIYDTVVAPLLNRWKELAANRRPWPDFNKIEQIDMEGGYIHLYPEGWGASTVARVRERSDKERCELILSEVAENEELSEEAATILRSADKLVEEIRTYKSQLNDKLENVAKFWPGTKRYRFKEVKICPTCKEIFG